MLVRKHFPDNVGYVGLILELPSSGEYISLWLINSRPKNVVEVQNRVRIRNAGSGWCMDIVEWTCDNSFAGRRGKVFTSVIAVVRCQAALAVGIMDTT